MALSSVNGVTSKFAAGNYGAEWLSITSNTAVLQAQFYNKLFKQFGSRAMALELLNILGSVIDVPDATITSVEQTWPQHPIKLGAAITTGDAGGSISAQLHADNFNTNGNHQVKVGDVIMIPAKYQPTAVLASRGYVVHSMSTTVLEDDTLLCYPLSNGSTVTKSQISVEVPVNSYLFVAYNTFARGTGQPSGVTDSFTTRTHTSFLSKWTVGFEGDIIARSYEDVTGLEGTGKFTNAKLIEAEFKLNEVIENAIMFGELNDNTNLVETSDFGGSNSRASGFGIYQWADQLAQTHNYDTAVSFDDLYTAAQLASSQDVANGTMMWYAGDQFMRDLEEAGLSWTKEFSGGTDLYDNVKNRLGIVVRAVTVGGLDNVFYPIPLFSKAGGAGVMTAGEYLYEFPRLAIGIPQENVMYESFGTSRDSAPKSIPNVTLAYTNHNGENNRKVLKINKGVSGAIPGQDAFIDSHGFYYWMLSQYMIICGGVNQWVLMRSAK
jgi:hypothetical protein